MGNTNTFWESGTRLGALPVGKTGKQMIGDREMSEDCRSPKEAPYPLKKVREVFLEEAVFEVGRSTGLGRLRTAQGRREAKEESKKQFTTMACLLGSVFEPCPKTDFPPEPNLLLSKTIPQHGMLPKCLIL